jgi:hypothetical protein
MIKPFTAIAAIILDNLDLYHEGQFNFRSGNLYVSAINNISISLSLYCLVLFYKATEERLAPFDPFYKFLTVKSILFFSFWQSCFFQLMHYFEVVDQESGSMALNLLTCAEMVVISYAQSQAFNVSQFRWRKGARKDCCLVTAFTVLFSARDVFDDAHNTFIKDTIEERERET